MALPLFHPDHGPSYPQKAGWDFLGRIPLASGCGYELAFGDLWSRLQPDGRLALLIRLDAEPDDYLSREETPARWLDILRQGDTPLRDLAFKPPLLRQSWTWMEAIYRAYQKGLLASAES